MQIGTALSLANPGEIISVRLPSGRIVQAKAANQINSENVLVVRAGADILAFSSSYNQVLRTEDRVSRHRPKKKLEKLYPLALAQYQLFEGNSDLIILSYGAGKTHQRNTHFEDWFDIELFGIRKSGRKAEDYSVGYLEWNNEDDYPQTVTFFSPKYERIYDYDFSQIPDENWLWVVYLGGAFSSEGFGTANGGTKEVEYEDGHFIYYTSNLRFFYILVFNNSDLIFPNFYTFPIQYGRPLYPYSESYTVGNTIRSADGNLNVSNDSEILSEHTEYEFDQFGNLIETRNYAQSRITQTASYNSTVTATFDEERACFTISFFNGDGMEVTEGVYTDIGSLSYSDSNSLDYEYIADTLEVINSSGTSFGADEEAYLLTQFDYNGSATIEENREKKYETPVKMAKGKYRTLIERDRYEISGSASHSSSIIDATAPYTPPNNGKPEISVTYICSRHTETEVEIKTPRLLSVSENGKISLGWETYKYSLDVYDSSGNRNVQGYVRPSYENIKQGILGSYEIYPDDESHQADFYNYTGSVQSRIREHFLYDSDLENPLVFDMSASFLLFFDQIIVSEGLIQLSSPNWNRSQLGADTEYTRHTLRLSTYPSIALIPNTAFWDALEGTEVVIIARTNAQTVYEWRGAITTYVYTDNTEGFNGSHYRTVSGMTVNVTSQKNIKYSIFDELYSTYCVIFPVFDCYAAFFKWCTQMPNMGRRECTLAQVKNKYRLYICEIPFISELNSRKREEKLFVTELILDPNTLRWRYKSQIEHSFISHKKDGELERRIGVSFYPTKSTIN